MELKLDVFLCSGILPSSKFSFMGLQIVLIERRREEHQRALADGRLFSVFYTLGLGASSSSVGARSWCRGICLRFANHSLCTVKPSFVLEVPLGVQALHVVLMRRRLVGVEEPVVDDVVVAYAADVLCRALPALLHVPADYLRVEAEHHDAVVHLLLLLAARCELTRQKRYFSKPRESKSGIWGENISMDRCLV